MSFFMKMTALGAAKIAAAEVGGTAVSFTHIAVGDGNGNPVGEPTGNETALVREVHREQIAALYITPEDNTIFKAEMTIAAAVGGWTVREIGVFDIDGDLIAYGNFPDTYKPTAAEGSTKDMTIVAITRVANASVINLVIDATVVLASRDWVLNNINLGVLLPGGLTNQLLAKQSNADGDVKWVDITEGIQVLVDVLSEVQTLAASQTVVNFTTVSTNGVAVYIEGVRLILGIDYTVTSATSITLTTSYPAGTRLHAYQNDPLQAPEYLRPGNNLSDVTNVQQARANLGVPSKNFMYFMAQS